MEHFNSILFHKSGPANKQQSMNHLKRKQVIVDPFRVSSQANKWNIQSMRPLSNKSAVMLEIWSSDIRDMYISLLTIERQNKHGGL